MNGSRVVLSSVLLVALGGTLPRAAAAGDAYVVEPYQQEVQDTERFTDTTAPVPLARVAELCGDADACTLRLVLIYRDYFHDPRGIVLRSLITDPTGTQWRIYDGKTLLAFGFSNNSTSEELMAEDVSGHYCRLRDDPTTGGYLLVASNLDFHGGVRCVLRIYD